MESEKRKSLADITNTYNLIPTSTLRELVAASSKPNLRSKPPTSILKSLSRSTNQELRSHSSNRSDASIGSSDFNSARNSRPVQFRNPQHAIATTNILGGLKNEDAACNRREATRKGKEDEKTDNLIANPAQAEKRKDKGKGVAVSFSSSPPENEAGDVPIFGSTSMEKREVRGKGVSVPFSSSPTASEDVDALMFDPTPIEKTKDRGKGVAVPFSSSPTESEADEGLIFGRTPIEKEKDKGKGVAVPFSSSPSESEANDVLIFGQSPIEKRKEKGKDIDVSASLSPNESGADVQTSSPTPVEKRKDKKNAQRWGEADINTFSSTQFEKFKGKGKAVGAPSGLSPHEKEIDVLVFSPTPAEIRKDKGKAIDVPYSLSTQTVKDYHTPQEKRAQQQKASHNAYSCPNGNAQKGKAVLNSSSSSLGTQEMVDKGTATHLRHSNERGNNTKGIDRPSGSPIMKRKEKVEQFSLPPIKRTKEKEKHLNLLSSLHTKTRDTHKAIPQPSNKVKAKHESSNTVTIGRQPRRRKSESGKNDAGASSCPPRRWTRNFRDEVGDVKSSKSWTDPHPKSRKKRQSRIKPITELREQQKLYFKEDELPREFVEQQKAYFKEVDEFELDEEEADSDE